MLPKDIQKKIELIQIKTKRKLNSLLTGSNNAFVKGEGYNFDQIREYSPGDDIRYIDFKSSARTNKLCTRQYLEERNRNIIIFVDVSTSSFYSSTSKLKYEIFCEIAGIIALVGNKCKDRVGICLFNDKIVKFIPPNTGEHHINYIMEQLFSFDDVHGQTDIDSSLKDWLNKQSKRSIMFLISDFINCNILEKTFMTLSGFCDLIAIKYNDKLETKLPEIGLIEIQDIENDKKYFVDLSSRSKNYFINFKIQEYFAQIQKIFKKSKVDLLNINADNDYVNEIIKFFNKRCLS